MSQPMTLLHLAANRWWTGSADPVLRLAEGLRARGHRVLLGLTPGDRFETKARAAGLDLVEGLGLDRGFAPGTAVRDARRLRTCITAERVQLVHAHHSHDHWLAWAASWRRRPDGVPLARTFHHRRGVRTGPLDRWLYRQTAAIFAVSRAIENRCREAGIPAERVHGIPGAADLTRFREPVDPRPIREEFHLGDAPIVVSVSRLAPHRGHELLLAGFRQLLERVPEARLLLVGRGQTRPRLEAIVREWRLSERVVFTGYRDDDLPAVLAAADCFALMAAGSDESCRAALEAMAAGRPVVAGRAGALPETVVHGETGLLIDDARPEAVAAALETVLVDRERARAMGRAGRRRAETAYDPGRGAAITERVYQQVLESLGTPAARA